MTPKYYEVIDVNKELPDSIKPVFAFDDKGVKYDAFYVGKENTHIVEFEDWDDLPEFVDSDEQKGLHYFKIGWYQECENQGEYDYITYQRNITHWLRPLPEGSVVVSREEWVTIQSLLKSSEIAAMCSDLPEMAAKIAEFIPQLNK